MRTPYYYWDYPYSDYYEYPYSWNNFYEMTNDGMFSQNAEQYTPPITRKQQQQMRQSADVFNLKTLLRGNGVLLLFMIPMIVYLLKKK